MSQARFQLRVQPRARADEVLGLRDGVLIVRVRAPALEGRANEAVRRMLAQRLGVTRSAVKITQGLRSRHKVIEVEGLDQAALADALSRLV